MTLLASQEFIVRQQAIIAFSLLTLACPALAQGWTQRSVSGPPKRATHGMVFDGKRGVTVVFGGHVGINTPTRLSDTWEWDGARWSQRSTTPNPGPRNEIAMAYDVSRGRTVLFGGFGPAGRSNDTWEWDGVRWTQMSSSATPPARSLSSLAYDHVRKMVVMFGGVDRNKVKLNDTWEWDGRTWTQLMPKQSPPPRYSGALVQDYASGKLLLFGGAGASGRLNDTWLYDGTDWVQRSPATSPSNRVVGIGASDPAQKLSVIFGGQLTDSTVTDEAWAWDGTTWMHLAMQQRPTARRGAGFVFDSVRKTFVMFGGYVFSPTQAFDDTWELTLPSPASYRTFGSGCAGPSTPPTLSAATLPRLGGVFTLEIAGLKPVTGGLVVFGDSNTAWGSSQLPLDLAMIGMGGCQLLVSWQAEVGFFSQSGGTARWGGTVPSDTRLIGVEFFNQAWLLDSAANPLGVATTNGGVGVIGN